MQAVHILQMAVTDTYYSSNSAYCISRIVQSRKHEFFLIIELERFSKAQRNVSVNRCSARPILNTYGDVTEQIIRL